LKTRNINNGPHTINGRENVRSYTAVIPSGETSAALPASIGHPQSPTIVIENFHLMLTAVWSYGNVGVRSAHRITGNPSASE
jgi:hypothetical protein